MELWTRPTHVAGNPLGHVRLVVDGVWHERTTRPAVEPDTRDLKAYTRDFMRQSAGNQLVPGRVQRGSARMDTADTSAPSGWPYQRLCLPLSPAQVDALRAYLSAAFPPGQDTVHDEQFQWYRNNCATYVARALATAIEQRPGGQAGEAQLLRILKIERLWPIRLRTSLERWLRRYGDEGGPERVR